MRPSSRPWSRPSPTRLRLLCLAVCLALLLMTGMGFVGCTPPAPTAFPLRLPTRIPPTLTPTPTSTPFSIAAQDYYQEGLVRQQAGEAEGALQSFTWAIQRDSDFAPAYVARGAVYLGQEKLRSALADADAALETDPTYAPAHALRGEVLRRQGRVYRALEAFDQAVVLEPALKPETFRSRWQLAMDAYQDGRLVELSLEYANTHPGDPLRYYYRGWALTEAGMARPAIRALVTGIEDASNPPALLWFALGHAYVVERSWRDAVIALETARALVQAGDISLTLHSDQPIVALFDALGRAYLGAGRCTDAQTMLEYAVSIGAPTAEYTTVLEEARLCQTPTPTATPYPTATPGI